MRFSAKLTVSIVIIVSVALALAGALTLAFNFNAAFNNAIEQCKQKHELICYSIESKLISDRLKGETFSKDVLADYADELSSYAAQEKLCVFLADGTQVFSNFNANAEYPQSGSYCVYEDAGVYTVIINTQIFIANDGFSVISGYDISGIYSERERQYKAFLIISFAALCVAAFAAWLVARGITKPVRKLSELSRAIAKGAYNMRLNAPPTDEIGQLGASFDHMVDALEAELDKRTAFVAAFSHELKTPMTSMIGYADILRSRRLSEDDKFRYADIIYKNSKRLENLSAKMLSMLGLSEEEIVLAPVSMIQIERRLKQLFGQEADIIYELASETVTAEQELLLTLLRNLAENAVKASDGTPVRVVGGTADGRYTVQVIDKGKGMSEEQLCRAAEPFYKADFSRTDGGCGIGLSICKKICELFGTELIIESEQGRGTTVSFSLEVFHE